MSHQLHQDVAVMQTSPAVNALASKTDEAGDVVKQAFTKFRQAVETLNHICENYNKAQHMSKLDANGLLDSYKIDGVVNSICIQDNSVTYNTSTNKGTLADESVTNTEIEDNCIRKNHLASSVMTDTASVDNATKLISNKGLENLTDNIQVSTSETATVFTHGLDLQAINWTTYGHTLEDFSESESGDQFGYFNLRWDLSSQATAQANWWNAHESTGEYDDFSYGSDSGDGDLVGRTNVGTNKILTGIKINNVKLRFRGRMTSHRINVGAVIFKITGKEIGYNTL
jgi:hypothetical protein